ncbi:unnamed protein product [Eruca vesicaria subsp. sativa]|uniref:Uncharacterized protein n=1 Tax=Eruca vesicaria subsp. sativa TaxID=29727 RepID=A0ABC8KPR7_ERUVS|nr:unnamed protein product [Eruca vesicaria subsp. sativa]
MDLLWAVLYASVVAVEIIFVLLVIILTMLGLHLLRMFLTAVTGNNSKPLEASSQVEEEQKYDTSNKILSDVTEIRSKISQIELDVLKIKQAVSVLQVKIESLESKQDATLSELSRGVLGPCLKMKPWPWELDF